jgi:hypothetical protein
MIGSLRIYPQINADDDFPLRDFGSTKMAVFGFIRETLRPSGIKILRSL